MKLDQLELICRAAASDQGCDVEQFSAFVATVGPQVVLGLIALLREYQRDHGRYVSEGGLCDCRLCAALEGDL